MAFLLLALMTVTNAADLARHLVAATNEVAFDLVVTIARTDEASGGSFQTQDASGAVTLRTAPATNDLSRLTSGTVIRARGKTVLQQYGIYLAECRTIDALRRETPPAVSTVTISDLRSGRHDHRPVVVEGTIEEVFRDETDSQFLYFVLVKGGVSLYATLQTTLPAASVQRFIGAHVRMRGACLPVTTGFRHIMGRSLSLGNISDIETLTSAPTGLFDAPLLTNYGYEKAPDEFLRMGRRRLAGRVQAVFGKNRLLLTDANGPHVVTLATDAVPACGDAIEAVGHPETDLYHVNLSHAVWRPNPRARPSGDAPAVRTVSIGELFSDLKGLPAINPLYHGQTLCLTGLVHDRPANASPHDIVTLKDGERLLSVDIGACRAALSGLEVGSRVAVTGVCVVETENWHAYSQFPHVTGVLLVPRSAADIRLLAAPPWWTPARLLGLVGSLLAALAVILIWNAALRHAATRKGRELFRAQIDKASSELRVGERTRLAVELHDSISQNLTGVSMQVDSARRFLDADPPRARRILVLAARAVDACRAELRNCILDLRSQALEEPRLDRAIETVLQGTVGSARVQVRFDLARTKLSDQTTHTILRIVRELAANAVRHGKAATIRIAGAVEQGRLLLSVKDDGTGFDPQTRPGPTEGHFGLQGVLERIKPFDGTMTVDSAPGRGTRVVLTLSLSTPEKT